VILVILLVCVGTCFASWLGFRHLRQMQLLAYSADRYLQTYPDVHARLPKFNSAEIYKFRTMCTSTSYILFYAILCYSFKYVRQSLPTTYELFNALAGTFVFVVFVCWRRSRTIITDFWKSQTREIENLNSTNMSELRPITKGTV
jgi:asparagine N-glycosylation enzyme membrane subunit Stt3